MISPVVCGGEPENVDGSTAATTMVPSPACRGGLGAAVAVIPVAFMVPSPACGGGLGWGWFFTAMYFGKLKNTRELLGCRLDGRLWGGRRNDGRLTHFNLDQRRIIKRGAIGDVHPGANRAAKENVAECHAFG